MNVRKIEQAMIAAIKARKDWSAGNTCVEYDQFHAAHVYLFGNRIAVLRRPELTVTLAGWNSPTTRSRLNALLNEFAPDSGRFSTKLGQAYFDGRAIAANDWIPIELT